MFLGGGRPRLFLFPVCRVCETLLYAEFKGVCHSVEDVNLECMGVNLLSPTGHSLRLQWQCIIWMTFIHLTERRGEKDLNKEFCVCYC